MYTSIYHHNHLITNKDESHRAIIWQQAEDLTQNQDLHSEE
jgi:hypothetical protein